MGRTTIKDIAREAGYSVGTVSRCLNDSGPVSDEARAKIMEVVERRRFQLNTNAKFLKQTARQGIAIVVKGMQNQLFMSMVEILQKKTEEAGYDVSLSYLQEFENEVEAACRLCQRRNPEGILFLGSSRNNFRKSFHKLDVPCVLVTNSADGLEFANLGSVTTDDAGAAQAAVGMLLDLGHRKIGILGGERSHSQAAKSRYQGAQYAFLDYGLEFDAGSQYEPCSFSMEAGAAGLEALLKKLPDMSAVFAMADVMAMGARRKAADLGLRVPEDLSIVGFDGIELADYMVPRLTTVLQDREGLTEKAVEMLVRMIEEGADGEYLEVPYVLCPGESVCAGKG